LLALPVRSAEDAVAPRWPCQQGFKCKFSHDLAVERKSAKIDLFSDRREGTEGENETMEDWDQAKLEAAIASKHGKKVSQIVLRWHVQQGVAAIPKSANAGRQRDIAGPADGVALVDEHRHQDEEP
jgi:aryl-alcohol dehydrogenase-like predicted oxidoreductase